MYLEKSLEHETGMTVKNPNAWADDVRPHDAVRVANHSGRPLVVRVREDDNSIWVTIMPGVPT